MMLGSKDAIRIVPYFVLPQFYPIFAYRGIIIPLLCSYVFYYTQDISPFSIEELYFLLF